jgi:hypothetical protein
MKQVESAEFLAARPQVRGLRLTPSLTASLRDRARREATTVHGALCAALINAGRRALAIATS